MSKASLHLMQFKHLRQPTDLKVKGDTIWPRYPHAHEDNLLWAIQASLSNAGHLSPLSPEQVAEMKF